MHSNKKQFQDLLLPTILGLVTVVLLMAIVLVLAVVPAWAQNAVPPTAREAAASPAFASRLAHHVTPEAAGKARASAATRPRTPSPLDSWTYENGPINGTTDAWTINFGYMVSDSFTVPAGSTAVTGFDFGTWEFPGDTLTAVDWSITSAPNGGTVYASGTTTVTDQFISTNQFGYDIDKISVAGLNVNTGSGTFYLNLQNAVVPSGDPVYWDENSGAGCHSTGCPSQAYESAVGTIPSEAFEVTGSSNPPPPSCFGSWGKLSIIYDFTGKADGNPSGGVVTDKAGNVYGATYSGGDNGFGLIYQLSLKGQDWVFKPLYSFIGGYNGGGPNMPIVGPDGALYGTAGGGIQNCGSDGKSYCGLVFRLRPSPNACRTALCPWTEEVLYRFKGGGDATPGWVLAFDHKGNLYGLGGGGANGYGAVFELTPSAGGWSEQVLYSLTWDEINTRNLVVGNDGNLYTADGVKYSNQGLDVFQLSPSGSGWIETVLYAFQGTKNDGAGPRNLVQDGSGNLYGTTAYGSYWSEVDAIVFMLSPSGGNWNFSQIYVGGSDGYIDVFDDNMTIDAAGTLYGTGVWDLRWHCLGLGCNLGTSPADYNYYPEPYVFRMSPGQGIDYMARMPYTDFPVNTGLAVDAQGNVFGTTYPCGKYNKGTVWQVSP